MEDVHGGAVSIRFGRFQVVPHRRELLADGQPVKLGGRAFDVLMVLIETPGAVIDKDELMRRVWPGRVVEENNLQVQISTLRAAFGPQRQLIRTVAGRGYQFTGDVEGASATLPARATAAQPASALPPTNLPAPVTELIGRDEELANILRLATAQRLVTLTGTGGIGKTQLALAAARRLLPQFTDGIWLVDLAPLTDPELVPTTVAAAARLEVAGGAVSPERVAEALRGKRVLIVLDNCEHVVHAATRMAEVLLHSSPAVSVIATSRELFRAEGEWVYEVPPLASPPVHAEAKDSVEYGATQLFIERARAGAPRLAIDRSLAAVTAICRRLDGIPLAIELAAAHAAGLGIEALLANLDDRFHLLTGGRRTAPPRHQTLRATLDWSFELLSKREQAVVLRLAVFAGAFDLPAASAVAAGADFELSEIVVSLSELVAKSLVSRGIDVRRARYHLLGSTRAYAREKLAESGELNEVARRHAEYYGDLFERIEVEWQTRSAADCLDDYGHQIDNLRAALDWAFSSDGDTSIGVALTAAAVPLWMAMSLPEECSSRIERALAASAANGAIDPRREMKLKAALGASLMFTRVRMNDEIGTLWTRALEIAEQLDDGEYKLWSLWGLWFFHTIVGHHRVALEMAQRLNAQASKRPEQTDSLIGERAIGFSHHLLGDQRRARRHIERALSPRGPAIQTSQFSRLLVDQHVIGRVYLARVLWLQGFADQALQAARTSVEDARSADHAVSFCYAQAVAGCPIALLRGNLAAAQQGAAELLDHATKHALALWQAWGRGYQALLDIHRGNAETGLRLMGSNIEEFGESRWMLRLMPFLGDFAEGLHRIGRTSDGLVLVDKALANCEQTEARWPMAEFLRFKGELLLRQGKNGAAKTAEDQFRQALACARRQNALSWELRAATNLAILLRDQGRSEGAKEALQPIYERFTEGFDTADLKTAKDLLAGL